ncbi:hypothetical protein KAFR_0A00700 [Kazachstania africana CBS 2517]|uniref:Anaphase-promoting complex subunit 4 WD40 domain-containing protein n=1 Tax=Kazachstania africana (strain ATCC 22294 / BCRC 22015 / CBS 2517 / CECT 1963 / NBRC 1671 / NRRL Y-8276) TaxID=1071382 RepID=H2AMA8_KAZAF|nr:hypothetical protein KAFR_0A00700 [Kazachstania africana CBS 2517]CCF55508.1 hypothetical protein KAFR_0A00700 [Kazachstania africana CBS 2517]
MSSIRLKSIIPPQPSTQRNFTTHLSYDETTDSIAYPCGKSAFVRSLATDRVIQFIGHGSSNVTVVRFSPIKNSQYLASGDESGKVIVWGWTVDSETNVVETTIKSEFHVLAAPILDISWDFEGKRLCVVGDGKDKFGVFISWDSGNSLGEISGHSQRINACHFKQSRPMRCITVGDDGAVIFYQGPPFKFAASDRSHHQQGKFIRDVEFSPNTGEFVVSVGSDRRIVCYDGKTGEFIKYVEDSEEKINGGIFAISWLDEAKFATASADACIRIWDVKGSKCVQKWSLPEASLENQLVGIVATKNNGVISLSLDGSLNMYEIGKNDCIRTIRGHNKGITALAVNPLITGSYDGRIIDWNSDSAVMYSNHTNLVVSIDNSKYPTFSTVAWDDTLRVKGEPQYKFDSQPKVSTNDNNATTAVLTNSDDLLVMNSFNGQILQSLKLQEPASALGLSKSLIAVAYEQSNSIEVFKSSDLSVSYKLSTPLRATPSYVSISPSEKYLAAGDVLGKILLFELDSKQVKTSRWAFHNSKINAISWKPTSDDEDEDLVATGSLDTNIFVYSVKRPMKTIKYLNAHKDGVTGLLWEDADSLVSSGADACIKKWDVQLE